MVNYIHIGLKMGNQEATPSAVVESVLLILEIQKLRGREIKRMTQETEDVNAKAGTVTMSLDSQPSESFFGYIRESLRFE